MSKSISVDLVRKYLLGKCTPEEVEEVYDWFNSYHAVPDGLAGLSADERHLLEKVLFDRIRKEIEKKQGEPFSIDRDDGETAPRRIIPINLRKIISIAAVLLIGVGFTFYVLTRTHGPAKTDMANTRVIDLPPGGNKALLTLSNGKTIVLDAAQNGTLAAHGHIKINKTRNGQLVYVINQQVPAEQEVARINTISTPVGGQYQVILPDGTNVWLNSQSSLRFPDFFQGTERKVEITGEVYFEVAKNPKMPFRVKSKNTEVEVLGTHFDIMAYDDEPAQKTTLLEGSVKISTGSSLNYLKPGQQAIVNSDGQVEIKKNVDLEKIVAWKNGYFDFENMDLAAIMRQAARWYGIQVNYKGDAAGILYTGKISKDVNLSELLNMLQYTGLKYQMDGKNITILP